jgi:hypothetical protein
VAEQVVGLVQVEPVQHLLEGGARLAVGVRPLPKLGQLLHDLGPPEPHRLPDVVEHHLRRLPVQVDQAPRRKPGEPLLHLPVDALRHAPGERPEPVRKPEVPVLRRNEVQHRQVGLVLVEPEPAAELLQVHGEALGGPKQEHRVHLGNVHALVVEIHREDEPDPPVHEVALHPVPLLLGAVGRERRRRDPPLRELPRHEPRVLLAHAEPEPPHPRGAATSSRNWSRTHRARASFAPSTPSSSEVAYPPARQLRFVKSTPSASDTPK